MDLEITILSESGAANTRFCGIYVLASREDPVDLNLELDRMRIHVKTLPYK